MTYQDRMERLCNFLVQMGHVVSPIYKEYTQDQIEYIHVQVALSSEYPKDVGVPAQIFPIRGLPNMKPEEPLKT